MNLNKNIVYNDAGTASQRINFFTLFFLGFLVLAASVIVYLFILRESFGSFSYNQLFPSYKTFEEFFSNDRKRMAVFYPYDDPKINSDSLKEEISAWENFLSTLALPYEILDEKSIDQKEYLKHSLIIIPEKYFLDPEQKGILKKYLKNGGSIFFSGEPTVYQDLREALDFKTYPPSVHPDSFNVLNKVSVFRGGTTLTSGIPAGSSVRVSGGSSQFNSELLNENIVPLSFYNKFGKEEITLSAVYGVYGKGRFIWMGFNINSVKKDDDLIFSKFIANSIKWLLKEPAAYLKDFPGDYNASAIFAPVISDSVHNIYNFLKVLSDENIKATFFIDPDKAIENLPLTGELLKFGELGIIYYSKPGILNENFSFYNILRRESEAEAINNMKESKRKIEQITGSTCSGCIIFPEFIPAMAVEIAGKAGFGYLISDSSINGSPLFEKEKAFLMYQSLSNKSFSDSLKMSESWSSIDSVLYIRGLCVLKFNVRNFSKSKIPEAAELIRRLKKKNFWVTTASGFSEWMEEKVSITVNVHRRGEKRVKLNISNKGYKNIKKFAVDVDLNEISGISDVYLSPEFVPGKKVKILNIHSGILTLQIENMNSGESLSYNIDYNN